MQIPALAKSIVLCLSACVVVFANPVGRVISSAPLDINGIAAPARNFVPVSIGDEITAKGAAAVVQFPDGSGVTLQPNSRLRIEGQPSNVSVRVLSGSAVYDLARTSTIRVVNSKGQMVSSAVNRPLVPVTSQQGSDPLTAAVVYRGSRTPPAGTVVPGSSILVGTFVPASSVAGGAPIDPAIILPNGETINLTATTNSTTGAVTYTVSSITATVTLPSGATTTLTITSNPSGGGLIGDTVTPPVSGAASGTSASGVTISTPSGPVTNANTLLQNTVSTGVTNAITNNTLPSGTTAPAPSPVSTGQFSNTAT